MGKYILLLILFSACSSNDDDCEKCNAQYVNVTDGSTINATTDCENTPPDGYVFVKCNDRPDY